jgi:hypothetical protein
VVEPHGVGGVEVGGLAQRVVRPDRCGVEVDGVDERLQLAAARAAERLPGGRDAGGHVVHHGVQRAGVVGRGRGSQQVGGLRHGTPRRDRTEVSLA